jgi:hypothetical protein
MPFRSPSPVCGGFHPRVVAVVLARRAGVLLAHMMQAFEVAAIFDLPALVGTDLFAINTTTGTCCSALNS